jgi:hypothetical protein
MLTLLSCQSLTKRGDVVVTLTLGASLKTVLTQTSTITLRTLIIIILASTLLSSCGQNSNKKENIKVQTLDTSQNNNNLTVQSLKHNLTDSLVRFSNLSEVLQRDDEAKYVLYLTEVNKKKIGVIAITDSVLFFFSTIQ